MKLKIYLLCKCYNIIFCAEFFSYIYYLALESICSFYQNALDPHNVEQYQKQLSTGLLNIHGKH